MRRIAPFLAAVVAAFGMAACGSAQRSATVASLPEGTPPAGHPSVIPTPLRTGGAYTVPATTADVRARRPVAGMTCSPGPRDGRSRIHVELFANGFGLLLPTGLGMSTGCRYPLRTTDPTGVVEMDGAPTIADLFAIWGQPLSANQLLSFHGPVRAYFNGTEVAMAVALRRPLRDRDQVVLEVGKHIPPHPSYPFIPR